MELRRSPWAAAFRLAIALSAFAVVVAVSLRAAGVVSQSAIVLPVILVGFAASWVRTARLANVAQAHDRRQRCHRVATVPVRHGPVGHVSAA